MYTKFIVPDDVVSTNLAQEYTKSILKLLEKTKELCKAHDKEVSKFDIYESHKSKILKNFGES